VTTLLRSPVVLAVPADSRFGSLRELVDAARAGPGKLTYGSGGVGSSTHLSAEYFESVASVALTHIPYRGAGDALAGLLGGQIDLLITAAPTAIGQWKNGRLKILAIATPARVPALQDVPTFAQAGVKGYEVYNWFGLAAPRGTPADIVLRLQQEVARALQTTEMRDKMAQQGAEPGGISPADFASMVRDETRRWGDVVKRAGIKAE
jgi:tripartite-type tricarboxylate transporter receptor subunit TctC